jgi:hypothetical protein
LPEVAWGSLSCSSARASSPCCGSDCSSQRSHERNLLIEARREQKDNLARLFEEHVLLALHDITGRKLAEEELTRLA